MQLRIHAACGCVIGRKRRNNEDNIWFDGIYLPAENEALDDILLQDEPLTDLPVDFCVFDGMGGQDDGQIAAWLAAETFDESRRVFGDQDPEDFLQNAVLRMNDTVWKRAGVDRSNLGTTTAMIRLQGATCYVANVGDSRIFRFRDNVLQQVSEDHTDEDTLRSYGLKNISPRLTQYIGAPPVEVEVRPFTRRIPLEAGDVYLLCSDGLTDMVPASAIRKVLRKQISAQDQVEQLIRLAMEAGGKDNTTVVLVKVLEAGEELAYKGQETGDRQASDGRIGKKDKKAESLMDHKKNRKGKSLLFWKDYL